MAHAFDRQYKETQSDFRMWDQFSHADEWQLFPDDIGPRLAIDESSFSNGELYTFVTSRDARTLEQSLVAVVAGTKSEDVITVPRVADRGHTPFRYENGDTGKELVIRSRYLLFKAANRWTGGRRSVRRYCSANTQT